MKKLLYAFIITALFLTQCSATASKRSFGETVDDNVIAVKLKTKYTKDKVVKSRKVKVKVWKGVVTLNGLMDSQEQINRAIELAEQQRGVKEVKAYLVLKEMVEKKVVKRGKKLKFWPFASKKDKKTTTVDSLDVEEKDITITETKIESDTELKDGQTVKKDTKVKEVTVDYQEFTF